MADRYECKEKLCKDRNMTFKTFTAWRLHMLSAHALDIKRFKDYKKGR